MLTIIHGDNTAESRKYFLSQREKFPEKLLLEGATLSLTDLLQAISGNGLFGDQKAIFIDELFSKRKPSKELDVLTQALANANDTPIFLWETKELTTKQLALFKNATVKVFKIPQVVFAFLDALTPQNGRKSATLFHDLLQTEDVNFALFMLQRQIRILLALSSEDQTAISEVKRMAPWQKGKLQKQAKTFSKEQLLHLHEKLFTLEKGQKTGQLAIPLEKAIDFFLLSM